MSYDVDEEGWQYSFTFSLRFAWHGTHPWYHSFVRRRRWLRERVKRRETGCRETEDVVMQAQILDGDQFTHNVSTIRAEMPKVGPESAPANYMRSMTSREEDTEAEVPQDQVRDILTLMDKLKNSTVDRERIDAIKHFIDQGGEELIHLQEKVSPNSPKSRCFNVANSLKIPDIMSIFLFQTSRAQLLDFLWDAIDSIPENPTDEEMERKRNSLFSAIAAAEDYLSGLEWWIDNKDVPARWALFNDAAESSAGPSGIDRQHSRRDDSDTAIEIKGIPKEAHLGVVGGDIC
jgi:hypothetical protein